MKLLIPTTVDSDVFVSSSLYETAPTAYNSGTTYAAGAFASVTTGTVVLIYESLQGSNTNHTPASSPTWWVYRQTTYTEYNAGTTYGLGDTIIVVATHKEYESLAADNTGNAVTDATKWLDLGSTAPWKPYDKKIGTQTERIGSITYELDPGIAEGIAFFNMSCSSIQIIMTDSVEGEVYNETVSMIDTSNVFDWYSYCFAPILTKKNIVITDLPPYSSATIEIIISGGSDTDVVAYGEIVVGRIRQLGSTRYGAGFEIIDYSRKETDAFGDFSVTERAYSKRISMDAVISNSLIEYLKTTLEDYRATPVVCIPTEVSTLVGAFLTYGFYRTARTVVPYPDHSILTIEWEGLT